MMLRYTLSIFTGEHLKLFKSVKWQEVVVWCKQIQERKIEKIIQGKGNDVLLLKLMMMVMRSKMVVERVE